MAMVEPCSASLRRGISQPASSSERETPSVGSAGVVDVLDRLALTHGAPHYVRFDNGPEFVAGFFVASLLLGAACELQVVRRQGLPRMRDQGGVAAYVGHHGGQREHHAIELQAHVRQFIRTLQLHARAQIAMCRPMH